MIITNNHKAQMKTKKKIYKTDGEKINIKGIVSRKSFMKMKAIALVKGHSKDLALDLAIDLYNEEYKEILS